jgi:hypothetical protein
VLLIAGLAWAAGLIHLQAAIDHADESRLYAVLFVLLAVAQAGWGVALCRHPARSLLRAGVAGSLGVVVVWVLSRTVGLPVGPDLGNPEAPGPLDVIATADELVIALMLLLELFPRLGALILHRGRLLEISGVLLLVVSSLVLAGGAHAH